MSRTLRFFVLCFFPMVSSLAAAQAYVPFYGQVAAQVSQANVLSTLNEFQAFGVKYRGTVAQANALDWLKQKYLSFGYTAAQLQEDPFIYSNTTCKNLVVTKIGTTYPNIFVIIDGHYDTVNGPGTNDNGSGTAVILEVARLLQDIPTEYSIKFIHFAGEEDGLVGSQHYVNSVVNATTPKMNIRLVLNLDEVGGVAGAQNNTITCEKDTSNSPSSNNLASAAKTNELATCMQLYSVLDTTISNAYASDYMPFEDNGEIITGLYETNESPFPHTANDVLANMDPVYVYNVAQGTVGAAMHFAVACTSCSLANTVPASQGGIVLFPNPAREEVFVNKGPFDACSYQLRNSLGQLVAAGEFRSADKIERLTLSSIEAGLYVLTVGNGVLHTSHKLLIN